MQYLDSETSTSSTDVSFSSFRRAIPLDIANFRHTARFGTEWFDPFAHEADPRNEPRSREAMSPVLRTAMLASVGASRRILARSATERHKDQIYFEQALGLVLESALDPARNQLTQQDFQLWHSALLRGESKQAGVLRTQEAARCGNCLFVPGARVAGELKKYLETLNGCVDMPTGTERAISPFGKAAWALYDFIRIHPFADGNGRMARLLVVWLLARSGFPLAVPLCAPGAGREKYIHALREADGFRLRPLIEHIEDCCRQSVGFNALASAPASLC